MSEFRELLNELEKRFGEDWQSAEIEEKGYPFSKVCISASTPSIRATTIRNKNGLIYHHGVWAEPKKKDIPEIGSLCFFWGVGEKIDGCFDFFNKYYNGSTWPFGGKNTGDWSNCQQVKPEHVSIIKSYLEL